LICIESWWTDAESWRLRGVPSPNSPPGNPAADPRGEPPDHPQPPLAVSGTMCSYGAAAFLKPFALEISKAIHHAGHSASREL
jgi:hypothetical protein